MLALDRNPCGLGATEAHYHLRGIILMSNVPASQSPVAPENSIRPDWRVRQNQRIIAIDARDRGSGDGNPRLTNLTALAVAERICNAAARLSGLHSHTRRASVGPSPPLTFQVRPMPSVASSNLVNTASKSSVRWLRAASATSAGIP
jgi:hypothetical protein